MSNLTKGYYTRLFGVREASPSIEESKLMSDDEDLMPAKRTRRSLWRVDLALQLLSVLMFVTGALMLLFALNHKQSDRACGAQLSIWCTSLTWDYLHNNR